MKDHLRGVVKPRNKQVIDEIVAFWKTIDNQKCPKYIRHFQKVISKVIERGGDTTGY